MDSSSTRPPWYADLLTQLTVASGVGYLAAAYVASLRLTRGAPGKPAATPVDHGLPCELLECRTEDGHRLAGWLIEPPRARATVILWHGMHHNRAQTLGRICFLAEAGYRCVAFDLRAHGESSGRRISFGYYESRDVAAVLALVRERWPAQPQAALGVSMGAAALCYASAHTRTLQAVILESLYSDIGTTFDRRINTDYFPSSYRRLARGVIWMTERRMGVRQAQLVPVARVAELAPAPVLVLTGMEDPHAPPEDAESLYAQCGEPRELWLVPGASHGNVCEVGGEAYRERVLAFLERWLLG